MLHSTYLETSRLESSMHPNFTKAMQGRCQGIYQRIWLYLTKYLYFATTWNWQWSRDSHYSSCLWSDALHSGTWNPYMVHVQKNTQDLQLPNLLLQPYSYPSCLKMPDMSWASIRTGNTPKRCWMSQDEKTARGHFDSTEKKQNTSFFVGFLRCVAAIAGHCTIDSCIDSCFSAFLKAYSASSQPSTPPLHRISFLQVLANLQRMLTCVQSSPWSYHGLPFLPSKSVRYRLHHKSAASLQ